MLDQYGGGADESRIVANKTGYLRLGIECLKAAFKEKEKNTKNPNYIDVDLDYLISEDSTVNFDWFERREEIPSKPKSDSYFSEKILPVIGFGIFILILVFAIFGLITTIKWLI